MKRIHLLALIGFLGLLGLLAVPLRLAAAQPAPEPLGEIAYVRQGDIYLHDLPSGQDRPLTQGGQASADTTLIWAPDGQQLLLVDYGPAAGEALLTVATGQVRRLPDDLAVSVWTPDAQALIGTRGNALVRLALPSFSATVLTAGAAQDGIGEPALAADGRIYYLHRVVDPRSGLPTTTLVERVPATGGAATLVQDTRNAGGICETGGPAVAGVDWLVLPTVCSDVQWAELINLHTGADTALNEQIPGLSGCEQILGWAHTHLQLAVAQNTPCPYRLDDNVIQQSSLVVVDNPAAPQVRQVVALGMTRLRALDWSPDDQWLAYAQYPADAPTANIAVVPATGRATRVVIPDGQGPAWRPRAAGTPTAIPGMPRTGQETFPFWNAWAAVGLGLVGLGSYLRYRRRASGPKQAHGGGRFKPGGPAVAGEARNRKQGPTPPPLEWQTPPSRDGKGGRGMGSV